MRNYMIWKKKSNSTGKVLIGTVAGFITGLTAGILMAPRSGKDSRDILSTKTSGALETAKATVAESKKKIVKKGKEAVEEVTAKADK